MNDFISVIDFIFQLLSSILSVITGNWLLSIFLLISIFGFVVSLILISRGQ